MTWCKSDAWREVLEKADRWRYEAVAFVEDGNRHLPVNLGTLTHDIVFFCDANTNLDASPLYDLWRQIDTNSGKSNLGRRVSPATIESMMLRCCGVLDRLAELGTISTTKPAVDGWRFVPGKAFCGNVEISIGGIKWKLLKTLAETGRPVGFEALIEAGWEHDSQTDISTLKNHLSGIRSILRKKLHLNQKEDPLPCRDRGGLLAWELSLPKLFSEG